MPEMKNLDGFGILQDAVVDQDRSMHELAATRPVCYSATDIWEASEQIDVVQNGVAESFRCVGEVEPGVFEDVLEIR